MKSKEDKQLRVGIPRALMYYEFYPLWKCFFEELGAEVVLSEKTTRKTLDNGCEYCINDACLPIKIFHGHVADLIGKVDMIFVPRLRSVAKGEYICPKFTGLPEMIKSSFSTLSVVIDTEIYLRKSIKRLRNAFIEAGQYLSKDIKAIKNARDKAMLAHSDFIKEKQNGTMAIDILENRVKPIIKNELNIAILGHVYNIYDKFVNMNLFNKLYSQGIGVMTPETFDINVINEKAATLEKKMFWTFGRELMGAAIHLLEKNIDGVIYIMSFGCGIDSFVADLCERRFRKQGIPFILLIIDEHSGEAGVNTRLEAFIDMIKWRKKDDYIPAYR